MIYITQRMVDILKEMHVREGDFVEKGQTLAELDTGNLAFDIEQTNLDLRKSEIRLKQMKEQEADKYSLEIAQLDIQGIKNRLTLMNTQLADSKITSPIDGVVTYVSKIRQGQYVPAFESLFQVAETAQLNVQYTALNANDLADIS